MIGGSPVLDYRIETFWVLYEQMNYRKTAEKLGMTQPGVTQHIHYLENYYGVKLFEYNNRQLLRTKHAELLKRHLDSVRAEELFLKEGFVQSDMVHLRVGATKTIGEFVITPDICRFLSNKNHNVDLTVDNTENLLMMLSRGELDFAVIEGVFDKEKYPYHLFKKERFVGICGQAHPFAGRTVSLEEIFQEVLIVRENGSGTRRLLQQAISDRGYSLEHFSKCSSISNFSAICEVVAENGAITFAYEPVVHCRSDLSTFMVEDMKIQGEFNFVYSNAQIARPQIACFLDENIASEA